MLHLMQLKPKAAPDWPTNTMRPNNAYNRQREPLQMTGLKGKNKNKNKNGQWYGAKGEGPVDADGIERGK